MNFHHSRHTLRQLALAVAALGSIAGLTLAPAASADGLHWFKSERTRGNGHVVQQQRALPHFDAIALGISGDVEVRLGNTESVTVETDDNIAPLIETVVEDGTLRIRTTNHNGNIAPTRLHLVVQAKNVTGLSVGGSGSINAVTLHGPAMRFDVGGSGSINVDQLDSRSVSVQLGGSGNLRVGGNAADLNVAIGGSGNVQAGQLRADTVQVSIGGSGEAEVWARQALAVSIGGSGDVRYRGDPPQLSKSVHGSGSVSRLSGAPR